MPSASLVVNFILLMLITNQPLSNYLAPSPTARRNISADMKQQHQSFRACAAIQRTNYKVTPMAFSLQHNGVSLHATKST